MFHAVVITRSAARRVSVLAAIAATLAVGPLSSSLLAQAAPAGQVETPDIPTSAYVFIGEVGTDGAIVRSGPSENDYPVMKLNVGTKLNVVAKRDNWLKIEPPDGAFCLVSQAFVDKGGDGSTGRIINNTATVRVGSAMVPQRMHRVPLLLEPGANVRILGDFQEYYKIAPPQGVYVYIQSSSVIPRQRVAEPTNIASGVQTPGGTTPPTPSNTTTPPSGVADTLVTGGGTTSNGTGPTIPPDQTAGTGSGNRLDPDNRFEVTSVSQNDPRGALNGGVRGTPPTTAPVTADAIRVLQEKLGELEQQYVAASAKPLQEQPLDELASGYSMLLADESLPPNARRVATIRAEAVKLRKETLDSYLETQLAREKAAQRQAELVAEGKELAERVEQAAIKRYSAIGRLAQSSLQVDGQPLFRLIDPATNRTILYVRSGAEEKAVAIATGLNQFIAINGQVVKDDGMRLTYIKPKDFAVVDPRQVNTRLFADYTPPSMAATNIAGGDTGN